MKKKLVILLMTAAVLLFAAGCGGDAVALNSVDVEMQQEIYTVGNATVELAYPVVSTTEEGADKLIETLNQKFQNDAQNFVELVAENYTDAAADEIFAYQADVLYNAKGMLSVVEGMRLGEDYSQYAATYSLTDGEKMTMGELMDMKEDKAEEYVIKMFGGIIQSDPSSFNANAADYVAEHIDEVQYYRYSEGLGVFFPVGAIAPAEMGVQEMVIQ